MVIDYELKFVKMQFWVKSILLGQQETKNFEIDKIRLFRDLDLLLKIRHQELKVCMVFSSLFTNSSPSPQDTQASV